MIYLDSSVLLSRIFAEAKTPPESFWRQNFTSSRLLEYEVLNRIHARPQNPSHLHAAAHMLGRVALMDMSPIILARALKPFPAPVRTLDSLHLATMAFLADAGPSVQLASYDKRLVEAAAMLGIAALAL